MISLTILQLLGRRCPPCVRDTRAVCVSLQMDPKISGLVEGAPRGTDHAAAVVQLDQQIRADRLPRAYAGEGLAP